MYRLFRYRFAPSDEQAKMLRQTFGCARFVWNKALRERADAWAERGQSVGYNAQSASLTAYKKTPEFAFLSDVPQTPLQQTLRRLDGAYRRFFKRVSNRPRYKRRKAGGSAEYTRSAFRFVNGEIYLPRMSAPLAIRWSRPLPAVPTTVFVLLDAAGRWFVVVRCYDPSVKPLEPTSAAVGIDMGLASLATLSSGERVGNPRHLKGELERLGRLGRRLARKQKGSKNREKARLKLARLHARVADRRQDHLHKLSTRLVRENQVIAVETLNVSGMMRWRPLARGIADASWAELLRQLRYKCEWYGRSLVKVDRFFPSSKTCSECGLIRQDMDLSVRAWRCECGAEHDRDHNAAKNILAAGVAASVCGPGVSQRSLRSAVQSGKKQKSVQP